MTRGSFSENAAHAKDGDTCPPNIESGDLTPICFGGMHPLFVDATFT